MGKRRAIKNIYSVNYVITSIKIGRSFTNISNHWSISTTHRRTNRPTSLTLASYYPETLQDRLNLLIITVSRWDNTTTERKTNASAPITPIFGNGHPGRQIFTGHTRRYFERSVDFLPSFKTEEEFVVYKLVATTRTQAEKLAETTRSKLLQRRKALTTFCRPHLVPSPFTQRVYK